ncbi:GTP-binding protein [Micromonosporaceae bacterium Da 78-11]
MRFLNLGILAHVDAGKTSLTERLLHAAGVIDEVGSVDAGSTQTDSMELERRRGITIKAAVVSFAVQDVVVNLIDTPGHPDFIAEVERVLSVLDCAVLVVSAVEGVQAQTRVLMRTLQRLRVPTLIFVNKIDRTGADVDRTVRDITERLTPAVMPMGAVTGTGTPAAAFSAYPADDPAFTAPLTDVLSLHSDALLAAYLDDPADPRAGRLHSELAQQTARALVHPVYAGSAITGAGVPALMAALPDLLPAATGDAGAPVTGTLFKIERDVGGEKVGYVRMFSGTVHTRDVLAFRGRTGRVTGLKVFDRGAAVERDSVVAGQIGKLRGLTEARVGDDIGADGATDGEHRWFAPPTLETVVEPIRAGDRGALHAALTLLAEQDPLINVRQDPVRQEISVSLYGEVQKEVLQDTLHTEFQVAVQFRETTTICIERPIGTGEAADLIGKNDNPFLATVGLRVEPGPVGTGVRFGLEVELGSMPPAFFKAVEEAVYDTLRCGVHGWEVTDCVVTMTQAGYWARQSHSHGTFDKSMSSTAGDFRNLTPLVLMTALRRAGSRVHEPIHHFRLETPADALDVVTSTAARLQGAITLTTPAGRAYVVQGDIPAARVHRLQQRLPALTRGEGLLESRFSEYAPVRGPAPSRPRTDANPLNRKEYLLHVVRRV